MKTSTTTAAAATGQEARDRATAPYYVLITFAGVYTKQGEFFRSQDGLAQSWGNSWIGVDAPNMAEAYAFGERIRAEAQEAQL